MILGVDYASVDRNAAPRFDLAVHAGLRFVIMRGTYGTWADPVRQRDWAAAKAAKLIRGAYAFPVYAGDPLEEADAFCNAVGELGPGDLPPTLDIEFPGHGISDTHMTPSEALVWLVKMGARIKERYGALMIYTSGRVWHEDLHDAWSKFFATCRKWLARYTYSSRTDAVLSPKPLPGVVPPQLGDADDYDIEQFQGDAVHFPGFSSTVDVNIFRPLTSSAGGSRGAWRDRQLQGEPLERYQHRNNLHVDDVIGPETFSHLAWERKEAA